MACNLQHILVVDDEYPLRQLFARIVSSALPSAAVDLACNGVEAVKAFELTHHGVILMDLKMPEMDGVQAATTILRFCKENNWQPPTFVFSTGYAPPESLNALIGDGQPHCLLLKPVTSSEIVNAVKRALESLGQTT